jgi:glycosyltransferase involved in cell wall biosynthesis
MIKVAILYRVIQSWRKPVFERLANDPDILLKIFYGPDFKGTKAVSAKGSFAFDSKQLFSFKLQYGGSYQKGNMPFSPSLFFNLLSYRPEVVLSEGGSNLLNSIQGFIYCKLFNKKFVWWSLGELHGGKMSRKKKILLPLLNFIERKADHILTYSTQGKKYFLKNGIPEDRISVAVNVIDTEKKREEVALVNSEIIRKEEGILSLLYIGALLESKRVDVLLRALSIANTENKNIKLTIIGDGEEKSNLELLSKSLALDNVTFTGKLFDGTSEYFLRSDILILPGLGGLAISEAMVHGLAIICTHADGCEKDLVDENNGTFIDNMTPEALSKSIIHYVNSPKELEAKQRCSLLKINDDYSIISYIQNVKKGIGV